MAEEPEHVRIDMTQNDSVEDLTLKDDSIMKVTSMETIELGLSPKEEPTILKEESVVVVDNQDTNQKIGVAATVAVEFYRALVASFLILFVPQDCGGHVCSFSENAETGPDPLPGVQPEFQRNRCNSLRNG